MWPIFDIAMFDQQRCAIASHTEFSCRSWKVVLAMRKLIASAKEFCIDLLGIVFLSLSDIIGNGSQCLALRIEAEAENVGHLPVKLGADLYCGQDKYLFLIAQVLNVGNRINAVMIGDRD